MSRDRAISILITYDLSLNLPDRCSSRGGCIERVPEVLFSFRDDVIWGGESFNFLEEDKTGNQKIFLGEPKVTPRKVGTASKIY